MNYLNLFPILFYSSTEGIVAYFIFDIIYPDSYTIMQNIILIIRILQQTIKKVYFRT